MKNDLIVVGIGSSAGGLEALQKFLGSMDEVDNLAFIVTQHLSPTHRSMMVELLQRETTIPVLEIKNGMVIKAKTIYITPENTDIYVQNSKIYLKNIQQAFGPKPSVNYFLTSLAQDFQERSIGVILSGTGSDGSYGVRAIKAEGGITIAQSPKSSKYDGMPISAINTGKVDMVADIEDLASEVGRLAYSIDHKTISTNMTLNHMQNLFKILFEETSVDFSEYKKSTLTRRISRRMAALKIESLGQYISELEKEPTEVRNLYNDILIGVTSFFRDKEAFESLREHLENMLAKKKEGEDIRIWVVGCSTGEEAYSIAILLHEILGEKVRHYHTKIFATDIDGESLKIARSGIYSEATLVEMDKTLLNKYFRVLKHQYEIKKELREMIVFSHHNIIADSPFLRLDMLTCRNMMIYFSTELQNRIIPLMHYALNDGGILMLGKSETVGENENLFATIDRVHKIYKAQFVGHKSAPKLFKPTFTNSYKDQSQVKRKSEAQIFDDLLINAKDKYLMDKAIIINSTYDIIYIKGEIPYLKYPEGKTTYNIFKLLDEDLSIELRSLINMAYKDREIQASKYISVNLFGVAKRFVRIIVTPVEDDSSEDIFFALFFQTEKEDALSGFVNIDDSVDESVVRLKKELAETKAHLQNVIEELESSYEETQSLNEELQSSNEELQSSNEELETTNEELQSTNEELQTAYTELRMLYNEKEDKNKQLEELTQNLQKNMQNYKDQKDLTDAIINTAPIAITMVNAEGSITYVNTRAQKLFGISKEEVANKTFDSSMWNISTYDDKPFPREKLPFSIIKKTYDRVFDIEHAITIDGNKLYLSVSGAPLFGEEGIFKGAVFSIMNKTQSVMNSKNIKAYQASLKENDEILTALRQGENVQVGNSFEIFQQAIGSLNLKWRNQLNELMLINDNLKDEVESKKLDPTFNRLEQIMQELNNELNGLESFFIQSLVNQSMSSVQVLKESVDIFEQSFEDLGMPVVDYLDDKDAVMVQTHNLKSVCFQVIEYVLQLKKQHLKDKDHVLYLESMQDGLCLRLSGEMQEKDIPNIELSKKLTTAYSKLFEKPLELECTGEELMIKMKF